MPSAYDNLVERLGEDGARAEMARRAKLVQNKRGGFKTMDKEKHLKASATGGSRGTKTKDRTQEQETAQSQKSTDSQATDS